MVSLEVGFTHEFIKEMMMTRIKIMDLPKNAKIDREEMKRVIGGASFLQPAFKTGPVGSLILEPEQMGGAPYNAAYFSLRKSILI